MKNIIFISPPAGGKGTQSDLLVEKYNYKHISLGDLLREEVKKTTKEAALIKETIDSGNLVSDDIASKLFKKVLKSSKGPFIFDGYPRTIQQAEDLEKITSELKIDKGLVIYLNVPEEEAIKRATGRMQCPECMRTYHKYDEVVKPKVEGKCDECKVDLTTREDDTEETYLKRYKNYIESTDPLINYYQNKEMLYTINNPVEPNQTFKEIEKVIKC